MKRISLLIIAIASMALLMAGCGLFGADTDSKNQANAGQTAVQQEKPKEVVKLVTPKEGIPVLMYHKVGPDKDNDAVIAEDLFRKQMKFLKDNGYHPLTMEQLYAYVTKGDKVPEKPVVLTFDDGYADTYSIVYPVLKEYGFAGTVFINPGDIGTRLTWDQVREMKKGGMTIANHGFNHVEMGQLSEQEQYENIKKGQNALAKEVGIDNNMWFCFPYGDTNEYSQAAAKKAGIKMAMMMKSGWAHEGDNPYNILRVWVGNAVDLQHFEERLNTMHYSDI